MKKLFIAALLTISVAFSAFAKDNEKVNGFAIKNFNLEFAKASNVSWTVKDGYSKAAFTLNNEKMEVFYDAVGEKFASSRTITIDQLPVKAKRTLAKAYGGYIVKEAIEFSGIEENGYYISVENEKETLVLKVTSSNELAKFKVTKK